MWRLLSGEDIWAELSPLITPGRRRRVAIAYVTNASLLPLRSGDLLVVDAEDATVASGGTDPRVIGQWLRDGVDVRSYPGLHAKVIVTDRVAAIGSANASRASAERHREAVLVVDAPDIRLEVRRFIQELAKNSDLLDQGWVRRTTPIFGTARPTAGRPRRLPGTVLPQTVKRMQLVPVLATDPPPAEVLKAIEGADRGVKQRGYPARFRHVWLEMSQRYDYRPGDLVCRVESSGSDRLVEGPEQVIDIVAPPGRRTVWLILLRDMTLAPVRFAELKLAVGGDGRTLPVELWLRRPEVLAAVLGQWGLQVANVGT